MERGIITITENGAVAMPTAPVWMTQQEMSDAFNVFGCDIRRVSIPFTRTWSCWKATPCATSGRTTG